MATYGELLQTKQLKLGTYISEFATPGIARILKNAGCNFAFVDMEHSGFTFETVKSLIRSLHDDGIASLVRPPSQAIHHMSRACDVGAQAIVPPMLSNPEQARACIDAVKFPPLGKRGCAFAIAHDDYRRAPFLDALQAANEKTNFIALIETAAGVEHCDAIAAMEGVTCLWIGQNDLSLSLGIPGEFDSPEFLDTTATIRAAAERHNKNAGVLIGSVPDAAAQFRQGSDFICYQGDIWLLQQALTQSLAEIRAAVK